MANFGSFDTGAMGSYLVGMTTNITFWIITVALIIVAGMIGLWFRRKRMLNMNVLIMYELSPAILRELKTPEGIPFYKDIDWDKTPGICDFEIVKGGWFKHKLTLGGLWDYGNEKCFRLADNTPVFDVSHNDYRRINGKKGIVVIRNPNDPKFAIPISKFALNYQSKIVMGKIAPVDVRNAASSAIEMVDFEMQQKWERYLPLITAAVLGGILMFSIIIICQYDQKKSVAALETQKYTVDKLVYIAEVVGTTLPADATTLRTGEQPDGIPSATAP